MIHKLPECSQSIPSSTKGFVFQALDTVALDQLRATLYLPRAILRILLLSNTLSLEAQKPSFSLIQDPESDPAGTSTHIQACPPTDERKG